MSRYGRVRLGVSRRIVAVVRRNPIKEDPSMVRLECGHVVETFHPDAKNAYCHPCGQLVGGEPGTAETAGNVEPPAPSGAQHDGTPLAPESDPTERRLPPPTAAQQVAERERHDRWLRTGR